MHLSDKDVAYCLEKTAEITEQYHLYSRAKGRTQRSVDDLEWLCGEYLQKKVDVYDLKLAADDMVIRGLYARLKDGSYQIYLLAELGDRERRFVKCKELFHVVLDDDRCRSMDIYGHLQLATVAFSLDDSKPDSPVAWEMLAEISAMEFLMPYQERVELVERYGDRIDYEDVASRYGIPQVYVENYLSEQAMAEFAKVM